MNKTELTKAVAEKAELTQKDAAAAYSLSSYVSTNLFM